MKIHVSASREYDVTIGNGLLTDITELIPEGFGRAAIVTDTNVMRLYLDRVKNGLEAHGCETVSFVVPAGEASKSGEMYLRLMSFLAENHLDRDDVIIALGGGVVGDLAGFAASTYLRGIGYVQLPTTLLAAVDSSVGGKTAINIPEGKNLIGSFYQPKAVITDISTLETLPDEVFIDGCGEIIKYAMLSGGELFDLLEENILPKHRGDYQLLETVIGSCVKIKRDFVAADEFDKGRRGLLNFGHTIGHSIETLSSHRISHGAAVAIGMAMVTDIAARAGFCSIETSERLSRLISAYGLPVTCPYTPEEIYNGLLWDKKIHGQAITLVVPYGVGDCDLRKTELCELRDFLSYGYLH